MSNLRKAIKSVAMLFCLGTNQQALAEPLPDNLLWLDVRTPEEYASGHIDGSLLLPYDQLDESSAKALGDKSRPVYVYCRSGRRSGIALNKLKQLGFQQVTNVGTLGNARKLQDQSERAKRQE